MENEEKSRIQINFRKNLEIFDVKIQHGETMLDKMPILRGKEWEARLLGEILQDGPCWQELLERKRKEAANVGLVIRPKVFDDSCPASRAIVPAEEMSESPSSTPTTGRKAAYTKTQSLFLSTTKPKQGVLSIVKARKFA